MRGFAAPGVGHVQHHHVTAHETWVWRKGQHVVFAPLPAHRAVFCLADDPGHPRAIAYLREELGIGGAETDNGDETPGLDEELMNEVMSDLDRLTNSTENVMEMSEKPVDDLSIEDIER